MSKHETWMTRRYWRRMGGTLIEEFLAVKGSPTCGPRRIDGVIIRNGETRIASQRDVQIEGEDIIVVQTKASRLGMYLMGQTLFSAELLSRFRPRSIISVALCKKDDSVLRPLLEAHPNMKVVICPMPAPGDKALKMER